MADNRISQEDLDLFKKRAYAFLATIMPDGSPQVTPVWVDWDGEYVLINSARGRVKDKNMERDPRVALTIQDPDDPYHYLQIRGVVEQITAAGADEHIDKLAKKYTGADRFGNHNPKVTRQIYKIRPTNVSTKD